MVLAAMPDEEPPPLSRVEAALSHGDLPLENAELCTALAEAKGSCVFSELLTPRPLFLLIKETLKVGG